MNSIKLCADTGVQQRSLLGQLHRSCPVGLAALSIGTMSQAPAVCAERSCTRRLLWAALSGYTLSLATMLGFLSPTSWTLYSTTN